MLAVSIRAPSSKLIAQSYEEAGARVLSTDYKVDSRIMMSEVAAKCEPITDHRLPTTTFEDIMKNKIRLALLGALAGYSLWRAASHDDMMTLFTAALTTLLFLLAARQVWRERR